MNYEEREENKARALADFARRAGKPEEVITAVEAGVSIHEIESLLSDMAQSYGIGGDKSYMKTGINYPPVKEL